jgi:hypothetical protein
MAAFVGLAGCGPDRPQPAMLQASGIHASVFDAAAVVIAVAVLGASEVPAAPR